MLALTAAPGAPGNIALREVADPTQHHNEALVRVKAISLNRGESGRLGGMQDGDRVGWDLAGVVERTSGDGHGPAAGTRVVGFLQTNAWAEFAAVPSNMLAPLRDDVTFEQAATLPVAGLTALRAIDIIGPLVARGGRSCPARAAASDASRYSSRRCPGHTSPPCPPAPNVRRACASSGPTP